MNNDKIFEGLDCCKEFLCGECPYNYLNDKIYTMKCIHELIKDLSKMKEGLQIHYNEYGYYECPSCQFSVADDDNYCSNCGQKIYLELDENLLDKNNDL